MRDVAAAARVSPMTVSRTLHNDDRVSADARSRVVAAVERLGYRRNEVARSLRQGRGTGLIGVVVTNLANPFYARLTLGIEAVVAARGLRVVLTNSGEDVGRERAAVHDLTARRIDGLVVVPAGADQLHLGQNELARTPIVLAARPPVNVEADCVLVDDFGGARSATAALLAGGHRRIAFLGNMPAVYTGAERYRGYSVALSEAGIDVDVRMVRRAQQRIEEAYDAAGEVLSTPDPPTALFTANSRNTIGALRAARDLGVDVEVAGFDDFEAADVLSAPLTVVSYDVDVIGRSAALLLLDRIDAPDLATRAPRRIVVPTSLVRYGGTDPHAVPTA